MRLDGGPDIPLGGRKGLLRVRLHLDCLRMLLHGGIQLLLQRG